VAKIKIIGYSAYASNCSNLSMPLQHRIILLPHRADSRGGLFFGQNPDHIPFTIKRFFFIRDVPPSAERGGHAHRQQHQFLFLPTGAVTVAVDDGRERVSLRIDRPDMALHVPPMLWLDLSDFTADAVCLVLTSDIYSEDDYIRDRNEFLLLTKDA
jgi:hypothetical protein